MKANSILIIFLLVFGCKISNDSVKLNPQEFNKKLSENNVQLLDVRTPEEYTEGHIIYALNINIEDSNFEKNAAILYKEIPIYVYCRRGSRSSTAVSKLRDMGFKEIYELNGGITEWTRAGLPVNIDEPEQAKLDFKTVIQGDMLVLVDFNATWCGPCKKMQPFVDRMRVQRKDEVIVLSIDTDQEQALAMEYDIQQLPTIMLFRKGKILERSIGYLDDAQLNALVDKNK